MPDLLFECFSEEMPARMQPAAARQLQEKLATALQEARLNYDSIVAHVSPRHLAVIVRGLPLQQPDQTIERKGPKCSANLKAIEGFCRSVGMEKDALEVREIAGEPTYFAVKEEKGQSAHAAIQKELEQLLRSFHWPKSMRWGDHDVHWVRPLQSLLCLFDEEVIPVSFGHLTAGNTTFGHRFLAPEAIIIKTVDDYIPALEQACVAVEWDVRRQRIQTELEEVAAECRLKLVEDANLLEEVTGLVEWPVVLIGRFEEHYLKLPPEVLLSEMREHQKYFGLRHNDGSMSNHFLVVANLPTADGGDAIVNGNARVLRARLADGEFYWNSDRNIPLSDWAKKLDGLIFHAKIGSVKDRADRMERLAPLLAVFVPHAHLSECARAAQLAKADLVTGMVGEFPELQGFMGRYYALDQNEPQAVANALSEHYAPQGLGDQVPVAPVSIVTALCDKFDLLVSLFAIGEKPTGSKDPFAQRRAALGILRILLENEIRMSLRLASEKAASLLPKSLFNDSYDATITDLMQFFEDRLKVMLKERGIRHDVISAVMADKEDDVVLVTRKAEAIRELLDSPDGGDLLAAYKRANNILSAEEQKDGHRYDDYPEESLLEDESEATLYKALAAIEKPVAANLKAEQFAAVMQQLASLRAPLDAFFDQVMINTEDDQTRRNRLRLLNLVRWQMNQIADFSRIEGS